MIAETSFSGCTFGSMSFCNGALCPPVQDKKTPKNTTKKHQKKPQLPLVQHQLRRPRLFNRGLLSYSAWRVKGWALEDKPRTSFSLSIHLTALRSSFHLWSCSFRISVLLNYTSGTTEHKTAGKACRQTCFVLKPRAGVFCASWDVIPKGAVELISHKCWRSSCGVTGLAKTSELVVWCLYTFLPCGRPAPRPVYSVMCLLLQRTDCIITSNELEDWNLC